MPLPTFTAEKPSTSETSEAAVGTMTSEQPKQHDHAASSSKPQTKSEAEIAAEKLYEERIEDEYAKREGGA